MSDLIDFIKKESPNVKIQELVVDEAEAKEIKKRLNFEDVPDFPNWQIGRLHEKDDDYINTLICKDLPDLNNKIIFMPSTSKKSTKSAEELDIEFIMDYFENKDYEVIKTSYIKNNENIIDTITDLK